MRSKAEILKIATSGGGCAYYDGTVYDGEVGSIEDAMDLFAKEQCICLLDYLYSRAVETVANRAMGGILWRLDIGDYYSSSEQLFNQFLQEIKQDK